MSQCFGDQAVHELFDGGLELSSFESGHQRHLSAQISCRFRPLSGRGRIAPRSGALLTALALGELFAWHQSRQH
jgi:hypothetical protein